jgi:SAM-dependent methyltransferase
MYHSPRMYEFMIKLAHRKTFDARIRTIMGFIGNTDVLELGCGTATIETYLPKGTYLGVDMNERFVRYAQKQGRNAVWGDINHFKNYITCDVTVLLMDILHHIPNYGELVNELLKQNIRQIIICEPYDLPESRIHSSKLLNRLFDADGINSQVKWLNKTELLSFYKAYHASDVVELSDSIIAQIEVNKPWK